MLVPVFVLTGGDPIKRPDLFDLIGHARSRGVRVSLTPSATPLLTREVVVRLKEAGLARLAVSMDGASPEPHDAFRGMSGSFARTLSAIGWANEIGLPTQINTTFSRRNIGEIDEIVALMETLKITLWSVFFLVPTGRGKLNDLLNAEEFEQVFAKIYALSKTARFDIKTTEAQHYRRFVLQQRAAERRAGMQGAASDRVEDSIGRAPRGLNDGKGFVFVSHTGEVFPSEFLPLTAGIQISAGKHARLKRLLRSACSRQLYTRGRGGIDHQVHILAHEPEGKFRGVVAILDLSELSQKRGRNDGRFGEYVE
jgi:MoaA/NifB/PqqE/SkfB family radical SAM enzyme